jgi:hypothetical protein
MGADEMKITVVGAVLVVGVLLAVLIAALTLTAKSAPPENDGH